MGAQIGCHYSRVSSFQIHSSLLFLLFFAWQKKQPNVRLLAILEKKKFLKLSSALCVDLAISRTFLSSDAILVGWLDLFLSFVKAKNEEH